jgi:hypothetical protein
MHGSDGVRGFVDRGDPAVVKGAHGKKNASPVVMNSRIASPARNTRMRAAS